MIFGLSSFDWLTVDNFALAVVLLSLIPSVVRVFIGPTVMDRIAASDATGNVLVILFVIYAYARGSEFLFDIGVLLAIVSFIGTVALAKYIDRGDVV